MFSPCLLASPSRALRSRPVCCAESVVARHFALCSVPIGRSLSEAALYVEIDKEQRLRERHVNEHANMMRYGEVDTGKADLTDKMTRTTRERQEAIIGSSWYVAMDKRRAY